LGKYQPNPTFVQRILLKYNDRRSATSHITFLRLHPALLLCIRHSFSKGTGLQRRAMSGAVRLVLVAFLCREMVANQAQSKHLGEPKAFSTSVGKCLLVICFALTRCVAFEVVRHVGGLLCAGSFGQRCGIGGGACLGMYPTADRAYHHDLSMPISPQIFEDGRLR
jgi:hypothetical protein